MIAIDTGSFTVDTSSIVVAVVVLLILKGYLNGRKPRGLPPGPPGIPFVGELLFFIVIIIYSRILLVTVVL